jgi:hypothetical protein
MENSKVFNITGCPAVNNLPCGMLIDLKLVKKNMVGSRVINNPNKDQGLIYKDLSVYYSKISPAMASSISAIRDDLLRNRGY